MCSLINITFSGSENSEEWTEKLQPEGNLTPYQQHIKDARLPAKGKKKTFSAPSKFRAYVTDQYSQYSSL